MKKQKELNHIIVHHTISLRTWTHQTTLTLPIIYIPYSCLKIIGSYRAAKYLMSFSKALDGFYIVQCLHLRYTYLPICLLTIIFIDDSYRTFMCRKMCRKTIARTHVNFHYHHVCVTNCLLSRKSSRTRYFAIFLHTHTHTRARHVITIQVAIIVLFFEVTRNLKKPDSLRLSISVLIIDYETSQPHFGPSAIMQFSFFLIYLSFTKVLKGIG